VSSGPPPSAHTCLSSMFSYSSLSSSVPLIDLHSFPTRRSSDLRIMVKIKYLMRCFYRIGVLPMMNWKSTMINLKKWQVLQEKKIQQVYGAVQIIRHHQ